MMYTFELWGLHGKPMDSRVKQKYKPNTNQPEMLSQKTSTNTF